MRLPQKLLTPNPSQKRPPVHAKILESYISACIRHRTIMDIIIPATGALEERGTMEAAFKAAQIGAESTRVLRPLLGRATLLKYGNARLAAHGCVPARFESATEPVSFEVISY